MFRFHFLEEPPVRFFLKLINFAWYELSFECKILEVDMATFFYTFVFHNTFNFVPLQKYPDWISVCNLSKSLPVLRWIECCSF